MNEYLIEAFDYVRKSREELMLLIEEPVTNGGGFHSRAWEQAFTQAFDQILALRDASIVGDISVADAVALGGAHIEQICNLIDALLSMPENKLTCLYLCSMTFCKLDTAKRFFEYALQEDEEARLGVASVD